MPPAAGTKRTQSQLAENVRSTRSMINRLEDADDEGNSLAMLLVIAKAVGHVAEIRVVPVEAGR